MRLVLSKSYEDISGYTVEEDITVFKNHSFEYIIEYLKDENYEYREDLDMWYSHDIEDWCTYIAKIYNN